MSYANMEGLVKRLVEAGEASHAHEVVIAWDEAMDVLEDERDDAPDWRPPLEKFRRLEAEGRRLLGEAQDAR